MAGKEIYIEKILDQSLSGIPQMVAEMQQSTRILSNILANTGLTQSQKSFSGTDLSSLTIVNDLANTYTSDIEVTGNTGNAANKFMVNSKNSATMGTYQQHVAFKKIVNNAKNLKLDLYTINTSGGMTTTITIYGDNTVIDTYVNNVYNSGKTWHIDIDIENYSSIKIDAYSNGMNNGSIQLSNIYIDDNDVIFTSNGQLYFSSNEIHNKVAVNNCVLVSGVGHVDFSGNITGAAVWSSLIINGNLTGIKMSIIDTTTNEKIMDLPASVNDISTLTKLTGFAVKFEFGEGSENSYISSVIFRYY